MPNPADKLALRDGLIAVTTFAATLPLTRIALEGFAPLPLTFGRLLGASISAMLALKIAGATWPRRHQLLRLLLVALGGVIGFPLLTALALDGREAAPAAIPLALMPLATAAWSRLRGHEKPSYGFWLWAIAGNAIVLQFVWITGTTLAAPQLFIAGLAAAIAYAEGGRLAREMPGWQVMAWALALTVPVAGLGFGYTWARLPLPLSAAPWMALAFLALITQFGAFWFWYRALSTGVSRTSQLQLLQPFLTLLLAAALLGESIPAELWFYATAVAITVHLARSLGLRIQQPKETTS
jgi:drug/metabolite transporter (DMT)-like permease